MPQSSFSGQVSAWVAATKQRTEAVFRESTQRVIDVMQTTVDDGGNLPRKTGFLRASLKGTLGEPGFSVTFNPSDGTTYTYDAGAIALVIASAKIGDRISAVYSANYALYAEYGTSKMAARMFVALAAQNWPQIVNAVAQEAQARAGG